MDCINQPVVHKKFGEGRIKAHDGRTMTVWFHEYGSRTFLYPEGFDQFLTAKDPAFAKTVAADLDQAWEAQADAEREHREHVQSLTEQARLARIEERRASRKPAAARKAAAPKAQ